MSVSTIFTCIQIWLTIMVNKFCQILNFQGYLMVKLSNSFIKFFGIILIMSLLTACSTLGFGDDEMASENNMEMDNSADAMTQDSTDQMSEPALTPQEELMMQKDEALMAQAMRLAEAERALIALQEQNSALEADLTQARQDANEKQAMLDEQNERQINQAAPEANAMRMTAPDGGYGLHVASFELQESIAPGLAAIERQIPVLTEGRPIKIAMADVRGRTFHRLIIGQFNSQSEAVAECNQAKLLIDFCDVIAFEGEDF